MSCNLHAASAAGAASFPARRSPSWRAFLARAVDQLQAWRMRRQQRRELLDYLASDHRAASDIGITGYDARAWSERPFWRS
jgi:uncharacterized protein YjiS (DUF1127 family)